jgi:hypothetical protein
MVAKRFKIRLAIIYFLLSVMVWFVRQAQSDARHAPRLTISDSP